MNRMDSNIQIITFNIVAVQGKTHQYLLEKLPKLTCITYIQYINTVTECKKKSKQGVIFEAQNASQLLVKENSLHFYFRKPEKKNWLLWRIKQTQPLTQQFIASILVLQQGLRSPPALEFRKGHQEPGSVTVTR